MATRTIDAIWSDEIARIAHYLDSKKRLRERQQDRVVPRVNGHMWFTDTQQRLREQEAEREQQAAEEDGADAYNSDTPSEPELALDFLDGVSAADMKSLLDAEAARLSAPPTVMAASLASLAADGPPATSSEMAPLAMPTHLLAKNSPPKLYATAAKPAQLTPKFVVPPARAATTATTTAATVATTALLSSSSSSVIDEDASVTELMTELELDLSDVNHHLPRASASALAGEETKSEANELPPRSRASADPSVAAPSSMDALARSVFNLPSRSNNSSQPAPTPASRVDAPASAGVAVDPDRVAAEMQAWVTGYRDPDVIRRKEAMAQRARRQTMRFGVNSVEEQQLVARAAKFYAGEANAASSDSDSSESKSDASAGSDFSPLDDDDDDADEPVSDVELLSDDCLDDDDMNDAAKRKARRQRVRRKASATRTARQTKKKAACSAKSKAGAKQSHGDSGVKATATFDVVPSSASAAVESEKQPAAAAIVKSSPVAMKPSSVAVKPSPVAVKSVSPANVKLRAAAKSVASATSTNKHNSAAALSADTRPSASSSVSMNNSSSSTALATLPIELLSSDDDVPSHAAILLTASSERPKQSAPAAPVRANGHERASANTKASKIPVERRVVAAPADAPVAADTSSSKPKTRNWIDDDDDDDDDVPEASANVHAFSGGAFDATDFAPENVSETQFSEMSAEDALRAPTLSTASPHKQAQASPIVATCTPDVATSASRETSAPSGAPAPPVLSESALKQHDMEESAKTVAAAATSATASATSLDPPGDESETETLDFNDIEDDALSDNVELVEMDQQTDLDRSDATASEKESAMPPSVERDQQADYDFGDSVNVVESDRQADLGFSDDDDDETAAPTVVAPHDNTYEWFFDDTSLRQRKLQQQQRAQQSNAVVSTSSTSTAAAPPTQSSSTSGTKDKRAVAASVDAQPVASVVVSTAVVTDVTGSNGLRRKVKPGALLAMSSVLKGKHQQVRRSIQVIAADDRSSNSRFAGKRSVAGVYNPRAPTTGAATGAAAGVKKSRYSEPLVQLPQTETYTSTELTLEAMSSFTAPYPVPTSGRVRTSAVVPTDDRYLSYKSSSKTKRRAIDNDDVPLAAIKAVRANGSSRKPWTSPAGQQSAPNENVNDSNPSAANAVPPPPTYAREPQLDIYDALHMENRGENGLTSRDLRDGDYKRPSAFKKVQEAREKRGITFVSRDQFLESQPIPKKKKVANALLPTQPPPLPPAPQPHGKTTMHGSSWTDKRSNGAKSSRGSSNGGSDKSSRYGPSSGADTSSSYSSNKSKGFSASADKSKHKSSSGGGGSGKYGGRSMPSSPRRESSYRVAGTRDMDKRRHRRSRSRSRSRSSSPRKKTNNWHRRSRSSSPRKTNDRSRHSHSQSGNDYRKDQQQPPLPPPLPPNYYSNDASTPIADSDSSRKRSRSMDRESKPLIRAAEPGAINDNGDSVDRSKRVKRDAALRGTLFDDDDDFGSDIYISDSDGGDDNEREHAPVDIRIDLAAVPVDFRVLERRVYVSGITAMMDEEALEELFAPFGIETDRASGFPAIDVFLCQRSLRPRGDACVTFATRDGAVTAVEELHAKIVRNCQIDVRAMSAATQRVLSAQFDLPRESWKCAGATCRADVSIWHNKCDQCARKRVFGPSRVRIADTDWLCSICLTANADRSTACHTCNAELPTVNRAHFYTS